MISSEAALKVVLPSFNIVHEGSGFLKGFAACVLGISTSELVILINLQSFVFISSFFICKLEVKTLIILSSSIIHLILLCSRIDLLCDTKL